MIRKMIINFLANRLQKSLSKEVKNLEKELPGTSEKSARVYKSIEMLGQAFGVCETYSVCLIGRKGKRVNTILFDLNDSKGLREIASATTAKYLMMNGVENGASKEDVKKTAEYLSHRWIDMELIKDIHHIIETDYDAEVPHTEWH